MIEQLSHVKVVTKRIENRSDVLEAEDSCLDSARVQSGKV